MKNKNTHHYYRSALKLFLPAAEISEIDGFEVRFKRKRYFFRSAETPLNDGCSAGISNSKYCTNKILERDGLPVPKATAIHHLDFEEGLLTEIIADLTFPVVIKPIEGSLGRDVLCNIQTIEELAKHLTEYFLFYELVSIEEFHRNLQSYRVLMFNKKILAVVARYPALVLGDGQHTLQELIDLTNIKRQQISDTLKPIQVDHECHSRLKELRIDLNYIPAKDESVTLGYVTNASRGGSYKALNKKVCRENRKLLRKAVSVLSLNLVGLDVLCTDINIPISQSEGVIIEANHCPSVRIHEEPMEGKPTLVTRVIMRSLIYRHPFGYLRALYVDKRTAPFLRGGILLGLLGIGYKLLV